jgi:hypothetical protein
LQTSQGNIIRIFQHFKTKLWNITNFVMLFQAVMKFLSRLVEFKILVNWGPIHWGAVHAAQKTSMPLERLVSSTSMYFNFWLLFYSIPWLGKNTCYGANTIYFLNCFIIDI